MMGHACLRVRGEFFALVNREGKLIIKTTKSHVTGLIEEGIGEPFSKGGRVFEVWVSIVGDDPIVWADTLAAAHAEALSR